MAILTQAEALKYREAPANREALERNRRHDERLTLHAVPADSAEDAGHALKEHYERIEKLLTGRKLEQYKNLTPFPLPSTEVVSEIFKELARALSARNRIISAEFTKPELGTDWQEYRANVLRDEEYIRERGLQAAASDVHAFLVVDLAEEAPGAGQRPAPFVYLVPAANVIDAAVNSQGVAEYLIFYPEGFLTTKTRIVALDDSTYRVFELREQQWINVIENPHGLGYCPARMFWSDLVTAKKPLRRKGPLSEVLGSLEDFLYFYISGKYVEGYASYPVVWQIGDTEANDGRHFNGHGVPCSAGRYYYTRTENVTESGIEVSRPVIYDYPCPACSAGAGKGSAGGFGPGSTKTIEIPANTTNGNAYREPAGFIAPPVEGLKYVSDRVEAKRQAILRSVIGYDGEKGTDQPRNEQDVRSSFEARLNALIGFKSNLEKLHKWLLETVARLRYGPEFLSLLLSYGDEFYLKDEATLEAEYAEALKDGLPQSDLMLRAAALDAVRGRNNPELVLRQRILRELEPYLALSPENLLTLGPQGLGLRRLQILKLNFPAYLAEFEREELPVTRFGRLLPWREKIALIFKQLLSYVERDEQQQGGGQQPNPNPGGSGQNGNPGGNGSNGGGNGGSGNGSGGGNGNG